MDLFFYRGGETNDLDGDQQDYFNWSNINNRHLNISSVLDEIGLKQYKSLFETEEVHVQLFVDVLYLWCWTKHFLQIDLMAFLLLTDSDLQEIGVDDTTHRQLFTGTIEKLNGMIN